jgi:RNA polymerase sigma-70 factor, ECF subfamily
MYRTEMSTELEAAVPAEMSTELEAAVLAAHRAGRARWPTVAMSADAFARWLRAGDVSAAQLAAHGPDLFVAAACTLGDRAAVAALEQDYFRRIPDYVARFHLSGDLLDELRQRVRIHLLADGQPRIRNYRGHGPLDAWLRTCAVRAAIDMPELALAQERAGRDAWAIAAGFDPDLDKLLDDERHRPRLNAALEQALAALDPRDKTLMRMYFVDGMGIDDMALIFHVHRATAARWLVAARKRVLERFQRALAIQLGTRPSELDALVRLLRSQIRVSVQRILGNGADGGPA